MGKVFHPKCNLLNWPIAQSRVLSPCSNDERQGQTSREAGTQSHGPPAGSRAAEYHRTHLDVSSEERDRASVLPRTERRLGRGILPYLTIGPGFGRVHLLRGRTPKSSWHRIKGRDALPPPQDPNAQAPPATRRREKASGLSERQGFPCAARRAGQITAPAVGEPRSVWVVRCAGGFWGKAAARCAADAFRAVPLLGNDGETRIPVRWDSTVVRKGECRGFAVVHTRRGLGSNRDHQGPLMRKRQRVLFLVS